MPVTRDAAFPEETARLFAELNKCCDGTPVPAVVQAVANLMGAALNMYAIDSQMDDKVRALMRESLLATIRSIADANWNRKPEPTDVPVAPAGDAPPLQVNDYCDLLRRYIAHVENVEGVTFLSDSYEPASAFTTAEIEILRGLSE